MRCTNLLAGASFTDQPRFGYEGHPAFGAFDEGSERTHLELQTLIADIGNAISGVDARQPQAASPRSRKLYQPGIGPHPEMQAIKLIVEQLAVVDARRYKDRLRIDVPYPGGSRQKCDLCVGTSPPWEWWVEIKMFRLMGDNGKPNDNMIGHILSPYPAHRSALTDCAKLVEAGLPGRKAIVIYGFDYPSLPMDDAIEAFEVLARRVVSLGARCVAAYESLVHPVHRAGRVFGWEIGSSR